MGEPKHIVVVGGGHAGCEAALAAARIGQANVLVTLFAMSLDSIAHMPCNPCIGGSAKGHLVREVDALGGEMGRAIDATFLQSRMLNASKGPAVHSLRAQANKRAYSAYMKSVLENTPNLHLREGEVLEVQVQGSPQGVVAIRTESGAVIPCDAVIICTGTYLRARCLYGETITHTGPGGHRAATGLSDNLQALGFTLQRFKTGTPARVHRRSIDFSHMEEQPGDATWVPFSFTTDPTRPAREQVPCHLTYTTETTHEIIRQNLTRSAMYSGLIEATGTRYCPSIEDKIVRFADKTRHPVFIEPEGDDTQEMYVQGMSSALPEDVQLQVYRSVPGLENCEIMRPAYAIEYDCIDATQLTLGLEAQHIKGIYFAGQICGSSGYEEAAAQGLIAGINAAQALMGAAPFILDRAEAYIGVLIDDLVTKGTPEPYRMMTSRAEYRLLLRQDNADLRLTPRGKQVGLIDSERFALFTRKQAAITAELARLRTTTISPELANPLLLAKDTPPLASGCKLAELIKRPQLTYHDIAALVPPPASCEQAALPPYVQAAVQEQVNIQLKYEGYIAMQISQADRFRQAERQPLPLDVDYHAIPHLRLEARQKLDKHRPQNMGQASRITGVSPADLSILMVWLKARET